MTVAERQRRLRQRRALGRTRLSVDVPENALLAVLIREGLLAADEVFDRGAVERAAEKFVEAAIYHNAVTSGRREASHLSPRKGDDHEVLHLRPAGRMARSGGAHHAVGRGARAAARGVGRGVAPSGEAGDERG